MTSVFGLDDCNGCAVCKVSTSSLEPRHFRDVLLCRIQKDTSRDSPSSLHRTRLAIHPCLGLDWTACHPTIYFVFRYSL